MYSIIKKRPMSDFPGMTQTFRLINQVKTMYRSKYRSRYTTIHLDGYINTNQKVVKMYGSRGQSMVQVMVSLYRDTYDLDFRTLFINY